MKCKVIGTRGGVSVEEVSCFTCLCGNTCRLLSATKDFGCGDWVGENGQRIHQPAGEAGDAPGDEVHIADCVGCGKCADVLEPPPRLEYHNDEMAAARPLQREFNHLQSARIEHIQGEVESERIVPPDTDESDVVCESCGDPDCSRPFPHHVNEDETHEG